MKNLYTYDEQGNAHFKKEHKGILVTGMSRQGTNIWYMEVHLPEGTVKLFQRPRDIRDGYRLGTELIDRVEEASYPSLFTYKDAVK